MSTPMLPSSTQPPVSELSLAHIPVSTCLLQSTAPTLSKLAPPCEVMQDSDANDISNQAPADNENDGVAAVDDLVRSLNALVRRSSSSQTLSSLRQAEPEPRTSVEVLSIPMAPPIQTPPSPPTSTVPMAPPLALPSTSTVPPAPPIPPPPTSTVPIAPPLTLPLPTSGSSGFSFSDVMQQIRNRRELTADEAEGDEECGVGEECSICLDCGPARVKFCASPDTECAARFCVPCLTRTITLRLEDTRGRCPLIKCPGCPSFVLFSQWKGLVPGLADQYRITAKALLQLRCAGCHSSGTLLPPFVERAQEVVDTELVALVQAIKKTKGQKLAEAFRASFESYARGGDVDANAFLALILTTFDRAVAAAKLKTVMAELMPAQAALERRTEELAPGLAAMKTRQVNMIEKQGKLRSRLTDIEMGRCGFANTLMCLFPCCPTLTPCCCFVNCHIDALDKNLQNNITEQLSLRAKILEMENQCRARVQAYETELGLHNLLARKRELESFLNQRQQSVLFVMNLLPDIERRANLYLRYVLKEPFVDSLCCSRAHCFKCKIQGGHEGRPCEQMMSDNDQVRYCPSCAIAVVKGDGCSSLTCICGHNFTWDDAPLVPGE